jgi:tetratricopeptide (TPR) repeat protein
MLDWRGIPGNQRAFDCLRDLVQGGHGIAFVGAGASAGLYPLWTDLIRRLADEAVSRGRSTDDDRSSWLRVCHDYPDQVVRSVKAALGEGAYAEALRDIFRPRKTSGGNHFTGLHGTTISLGLRGYITTNFDPGLLEARMSLRPDSGATGFGTWKDADMVNRWNTGDIFNEQRCPILFAHGVYERSDTVVLGAAEYRAAYKAGPFRRLFLNLWGTSQLVFIGFGFSDAWVRFVADEVLQNGDAKRTSSPRHIAMLGLREDEPYSSFMRDLFVDQYDAEPLFYPISRHCDGGEDHGSLQVILQALLSGTGPTVASPWRPPPSTTSKPAVPERWTHDTTEDELFTGRKDALLKLTRWAADPEVKVIAVIGMGGLGKTSLVGHWLRQAGGERVRRYAGLFFWSFYAERDVGALADEFRAFGVDMLHVKLVPEDAPRGEAALSVLRDKPILLVLDGLEVLQHLPGTVGYGDIFENELRTLLDNACRGSHEGLVVLTSRFPLADLTQYLGRGFRTLDLDHLAPDEGAALLFRCGVSGTDADRRTVCRRIDGHPLGLRIFALTLAEQSKGDPTRLVEQVFDSARLSETDPLERKLRHLLNFYERALPQNRVALLGLISLFRAPAPEATILTLARNLPSVATVLADLPDEALLGLLSSMAREHLLTYDRASDGSKTWTCHPVIRDHFRQALLGWATDIGPEAAGLLAGQPASQRATDVRELQPVLAAIELLLDANDFVTAGMLFSERLGDGEIFLSLPAPAEGFRCALGFVRDADRRRRCALTLSKGRLGTMLRWVALTAVNAGEFARALPFLHDSITIDHEVNNRRNLCLALRSESELLVVLGQLADAEASSRKALNLARIVGLPPDPDTRSSLSTLGDVLALRGQVGDALSEFNLANGIELAIGRESHQPELSGIDGLRWAALLVRLGRMQRAKELTDSNHRVCSRKAWNDQVARCKWLLGVIATAARDFANAADNISAAEEIVRRGQMIIELPRVLLARADLERCLHNWEAAVSAVDGALHLAAPRRMRLDHADALVMRARILLDRTINDTLSPRRPAAERAGDDLEAALSIARDCGYVWAERDALALLAEVNESLGLTESALILRHEATSLSRHLAVPIPDSKTRAVMPSSRRR